VNKDPDMDQLKSEVARLQALLEDGRHEAQTLADEVGTPKRACSAAGDPRVTGQPSAGEECNAGEGHTARESDDKVAVKRLQVLLWQACEREEKLREKLGRERAAFRTKILEYERVCRALSNALETTRRDVRSGPVQQHPFAALAPAPCSAPEACDAGRAAVATEAQELADCGETFDLGGPWRPMAASGGDEGYALLQARSLRQPLCAPACSPRSARAKAVREVLGVTWLGP
jgi:hypothetical protein